MINIAICDDEKYFVDTTKMSILVSKYRRREMNIYTYLTSAELLGAVNTIQFDIIFMDIELETDLEIKQGVLGFVVANKIKHLQPEVLVIYISSHDEYYPAIVRRELFGFLHKPILQARLDELLCEALNRLDNNKQVYEFNFNKVCTSVRISDVICAYSQLRRCYLVMRDGEEHTFYKKLDVLEKEFESQYPYFLRASKSYLVNNLHIKHVIRGEVIIMDNGREIQLSSKYRENFIKKRRDLIL